jgi:hypothetical protein
MDGVPLPQVLVQIIIGSVFVLIIIEYGLDLKKPYPQWTIEVFDEPLVRFTSYVFIYTLTCWSPLLSILAAILVVFLHLDHINFAKKQHKSF